MTLKRTMKWAATMLFVAGLAQAQQRPPTLGDTGKKIPATGAQGAQPSMSPAQALSPGGGAPASAYPNPHSAPAPSSPGCNNPPTKGPKGDPISIINGGSLRHEEDIRIPCPLIDLEFNRDYISNVKYTGPLGPIWSHSYDWRVYEDTDITSPYYGCLVVQSLSDPNAAEYGGMFHYFRWTGIGNWWAGPWQWGAGAWQCLDSSGYRLGYDTTLQEYVVSFPNALEYRFDNAHGRLTRILHPAGPWVMLNYNPAGLLTNVVHQNGQWLAFAYGGVQLTHVTTPRADWSVSFAYNASNELAQAVRHTPRGDETIAYSYRQHAGLSFWNNGSPFWTSHDLVWCMNAVGDRTYLEYMYPDSGWLGRANGMYVLPAGYELPVYYANWTNEVQGFYRTRLQYDNGHTLVTYARGNTQENWDYWYDTVNRRVTKMENAAGHLAVNYARNLQVDATNVIARNTQSGETAEFRGQYDSYHRLTSLAFGYNAVPASTWQVAYDSPSFDPTTVVDPEGHRVEVAYANQLPTRVRIFPASNQTNETLLSYATNGLLTSITNANGHWAQYGYDNAGYVTNITPEIGPQIGLGHDVLGHMNLVRLPGEDGDRSIVLTNDEGGRVTAVAYPDGTGERFGYDAYGSLLTAVDTANRTSRWTYVLGDLTSFKQVLAGSPDQEVTIRLDRDQLMNLIKVRDPLDRNVETYYLDPAGRVTNVVNIENQTLAIAYAVKNAVKSLKRFDGSRVDLDYNGEGNLSKIAWIPAAGSGQVALTNRYDYLRNDLLRIASNEVGVISNAFDGANRLVRTEGTGPAGAVAYGYDQWGNATSAVSVAGTQTYTFDAAERVASIDSGAGTFGLAYNSWNGLVGTISNMESGFRVEYAFDTMDRWTNIEWRNAGGDVIRDFAYAFDAAGMITQKVTLAGNDTLVEQYVYDSLDRLVGETSMGTTTSVVSYAYDRAGNRTSVVRDGVLESYTLGTGNRLVSFGAEGILGYNAAGCVTALVLNTSRRLALAWNNRYQLTAVSTNGTAAEIYQYDALGRRVMTISGGVTNWHVYDGSHVVADLDVTGRVVRAYAYGPGIDNILAMTAYSGGTPQTYYYAKDHLGSVLALTDGTGNIVEKYRYDAWGRTKAYSGYGMELAASAIGNRFCWQGREYSWTTGFYYFRARWYDHITGRWLSNDPIGISGGLNQYVFCANNPVMGRDPFGLSLWNGTDKPILFKPEHGPPQWLKAKGFYPGAIDGVKPPAWGGAWFKVSGDDKITTDVNIGNDGKPDAWRGPGSYVSFPDWGKRTDWLTGRKKEPAFSNRHGDWKCP